MIIVPGIIAGAEPHGRMPPPAELGVAAFRAALPKIPPLVPGRGVMAAHPVAASEKPLRQAGPHLLPDNATDYEIALSRTLDRVTDLRLDYRILKNPDTCPAGFLPYLAFDHNTPLWDGDWTEAQKRRFIKALQKAYSLAGSDEGVVYALSLIGIRAQITQWYDQTPKGAKGTHRITVAFAENTGVEDSELLSGQRLKNAKAMIGAFKRRTAHYTLEASIGATVPMQIGAAQTITSHFHQTGALDYIYKGEIAAKLAASQRSISIFSQEGTL